MNLYNKYVLPKVVNCVCNQKPSRLQRKKVVPLAKGNVLEIGIGSGLNFPFYNKQNIKQLTAIDPSTEMWEENHFDTNTLPFDFEFIKAGAENIPKDNKSFDTIIVTYTLCTIPEINEALEEMRRLLKPSGQLIFCEHGKAPEKHIQKWQNRINPIWKRIGGGCHLNRDIPTLIKTNGFKIDQMETMYIPGWKPASFNYWGTAKPL